MKKSKPAALAAALWMMLAPAALAQGSLTGRVIFEGTPPAAERVEVTSDVPTCGTHQEMPRIVVGADGGVEWAVVRVIGAEGTAQPRKGKLDQIGCQFVPAVQALPTGSTLVITSSDPVLHNAHAFREDGSTAFNVAVPIPGMEINKKLTKPGILKLRCDAGHTWMRGYIVVLDEPFHAVTDAQGRFAIEGIPPGRYEIEAWQEWTGPVTREVEISEAQTTTVELTLPQQS